MTAPMDIKEAAKVLRAHQEWRKGGDGPQTNVTSLTQAIDAAVAALEGMASAKPVAVVRVHRTGGNAGISWSAVPAEDAPLMRDGDQLYAAPQPAYCCDTITERARELIGLHLSEQEGLHLPTGREYQRAVDALAQAIGASHQHPRERALHQDAKRGNFRYQQEDDGA